MGERRSCFSFLFFITRACFSHIFPPPRRGEKRNKKTEGLETCMPVASPHSPPPDLHSQLGNICQLNCQLAKKEAGKNLLKIAKMKNSLCVYFWIFLRCEAGKGGVALPASLFLVKFPLPPLLSSSSKKFLGSPSALASLFGSISYWRHRPIPPPPPAYEMALEIRFPLKSFPPFLPSPPSPPARGIFMLLEMYGKGWGVRRAVFSFLYYSLSSSFLGREQTFLFRTCVFTSLSLSLSVPRRIFPFCRTSVFPLFSTQKMPLFSPEVEQGRGSGEDQWTEYSAHTHTLHS